MSWDNPKEYGVYLEDTRQEFHFPIGLAFASERMAEGKYVPLETLEKAAELMEAIKKQLRGQDDPEVDYESLRQHSLEEFCDVYQTLVNMAFVFGFSQAEIESAYMKVVRRNDEDGRYTPDVYEESWLG